jgi:hypothetical protein
MPFPAMVLWEHDVLDFYQNEGGSLETIEWSVSSEPGPRMFGETVHLRTWTQPKGALRNSSSKNTDSSLVSRYLSLETNWSTVLRNKIHTYRVYAHSPPKAGAPPWPARHCLLQALPALVPGPFLPEHRPIFPESGWSRARRFTRHRVRLFIARSVSYTAPLVRCSQMGLVHYGKHSPLFSDTLFPFARFCNCFTGTNFKTEQILKFTNLKILNIFKI